MLICSLSQRSQWGWLHLVSCCLFLYCLVLSCLAMSCRVLSCLVLPPLLPFTCASVWPPGPDLLALPSWSFCRALDFAILPWPLRLLSPALCSLVPLGIPIVPLGIQDVLCAQMPPRDPSCRRQRIVAVYSTVCNAPPAPPAPPAPLGPPAPPAPPEFL